MEKGGWVDNSNLVYRLVTQITGNKKKQYTKHVERNRIESNHPYLLAVNGSEVPLLDSVSALEKVKSLLYGPWPWGWSKENDFIPLFNSTDHSWLSGILYSYCPPFVKPSLFETTRFFPNHNALNALPRRLCAEFPLKT
jgi:hypothetical protein